MRIRIVDGGRHRAGATWGAGWRHEPWHKLYRVLRGSADYRIECDDGSESRIRLRPGRLVFLPGHRRHRAAERSGLELEWVHLEVDDPLDDALLSGEAAWALPLPEGSPWLAVFSRLDPDRRGGRDDAVLLDRVAAVLHWLVADHLRTAPNPRQAAVLAWRHRLAPVRSVVRQRIAKPPSVSELARCAGLSVRQLQRGLRLAWGCSPRRLIEDERLRQAELMLLADEPRSIAAIATACGYHDQFHFSRVFRRRRADSPRSYRQNARFTYD